MADDRPVDDAVDQLAKLAADFDDFRTTMLARVSRCPTGTIEPTFLTTPKADTLFLNGQTVSRSTYTVLWQYVQDNALVYTGGFTNGDGTTTFGLPNLSGRVVVGVGTLGSDTYALGATGGVALRTLTTTELPAHTHTGTGSTGSYNHNHGNAGNHGHGGGSSSGGNHGGHNSGSFGVAAGGDGAVSSNGNAGGGDHNHSMSIDANGDHSHSSDDHSHTVSVSVASTGTGSAFDQRQPYLAINLAIWT